MNLLGATFRQASCQEAKDSYKTCEGDTQRRLWLAQFVMDPNCCSKEGFNESAAFLLNKTREAVEWLTQEQLEGPNYINSKQHVQLLIDKKVFPERPHEIQALADIGVKQYEYSKSKVIKEGGTEQRNGTRASSSLTNEQYAAATDDLSKGLTRAPKRKAPARERVVETPEQKRLKASKGPCPDQLS